MSYADTDFFLALVKEKDWLKSRALDLYRQYQGNLWTPIVTLIEMLLLAERFSLDPERLVVDVSRLADVRGGDVRIFILAAHFMKEKRLGTFDAIHAAFCQGAEIISSDKAFERVGLKRIPLEG